MIKSAIYNGIIPALADTGYFQVLSGPVKRITRYIQSGEEGAEVAQSFPVSPNLGGEQLLYDNSENQTALVPDDSKTSIGYFENTGFTPTEADGGMWAHTARVRFVAWFNLSRMGIEGKDVPAEIVIKTLAVFNTQYDNVTPYGGSVIVSPEQVVENDFQRVFGAYHYGNEAGMFMYPFSFFAVDFRVSIFTGKKCQTRLELNCNCEII